MASKVYFKEQQRFKQVWLWLLLIVLDLFFLLGCYVQLIQRRPIGEDPLPDTVLIVLTAIVLLMTVGFLIVRMETKVVYSGIKIRYIPFQAQATLYPWEKIEMCYFRTFRPFWDFGGLGVRGSSHSKAYIIGGDHGLQLKFNDGERLLIGTQKPEELIKVLAEIPDCPLYQKDVFIKP